MRQDFFMLEELLLDIFPDHAVFMPLHEVENAIAELPQKLQRIIDLHYYENYSISQVAEICDAPTTVIRQQLHEIISALRRALNPEYYTATARKYIFSHDSLLPA